MTATTTASTRTPQAPPHEPIWEIAHAIDASRSLHIVANMGVANHVGDKPVPAEDLATACGADPDALVRDAALDRGRPAPMRAPAAQQRSTR